MDEHRDEMGGAAGGILLVGIGVIFLAGIDFFPWILVVIGLAGVPGSVASKGFWAGLQGAVWMIGLALLFAFDAFWPGILILVGLSMLAGSLVRPPGLKAKRKRGLPPDWEDDEYDLPDDSLDEYEEEEHYSARAGRE